MCFSLSFGFGGKWTAGTVSSAVLGFEGRDDHEKRSGSEYLLEEERSGHGHTGEHIPCETGGEFWWG